MSHLDELMCGMSLVLVWVLGELMWLVELMQGELIWPG
jgi:hypothetical protein